MTSKLKSKNFKGFFLDNFKVKERKSFVSWCEQNIWLPDEASSSPGQFNISLTPYMRKIYSLLDHGREGPIEIVLMFAAQLGKTQLCLNYAMYSQCESPGPLMFVLPTIKLGEKFSKQRLTPMIESCPEALRCLKQDVGRSSSQTMSVKRFYGGVTFIVGSNSKSDLSSTPVGKLLMDEIDKYKQDLDGEGNPIDMALKRTSTFNNKVVLYSSTPGLKGLSNIEDKFDKSSKHYYQVPCPYCNFYQELKIENLNDAGYTCVKCSKSIDDSKHKSQMLSDGVWVTKDKSSNVYGFHLSQLYAPYTWVKWGDILIEKKESVEDSIKEKTFKNLVLAETYEERGTKVDAESVKSKCVKDYGLNEVPLETIALTIAVDVQANRVEFLLVAWCEKLTSYCLDYQIIMGKIEDHEVQEILIKLYEKDYKDESGKSYKVNKAVIDSGFDTVSVYEFCRNSRGKYIPIKGSDNLTVPVSTPRMLDLRKSNRKLKRSGVLLHHFGVSILKKEIYNALSMESDRYLNKNTWRRMFFPSAFNDEFYLQLCAEKFVKTYKQGTLEFKYRWKKIRERNEALDLVCYSLGAAYLLKLNEYRFAKSKKGIVKRHYKSEDSQLDFEL